MGYNLNFFCVFQHRILNIRNASIMVTKVGKVEKVRDSAGEFGKVRVKWVMDMENADLHWLAKAMG